MPPKYKNYRIGETKHNLYGNVMTIVEYYNKDNIIVKFNNGYTSRSTYNHFKNGTVKNPYDKQYYKVGFIGEGHYYKTNYKKTYKVWKSMLQRCYDEKYQQKRPTYRGCTVCIKWHNFQNFAKWYDENYYDVDGQRMELDKDILIKGNKIYSPETCVIVPQIINTLFIKSNAKRGEYPIGVSYNNTHNIFVASGKNAFLGYFNTSQEAFYSYKTYKEKIIKATADKYKDIIPQKLYEAMYQYVVEVTD